MSNKHYGRPSFTTESRTWGEWWRNEGDWVRLSGSKRTLDPKKNKDEKEWPCQSGWTRISKLPSLSGTDGKYVYRAGDWTITFIWWFDWIIPAAAQSIGGPCGKAVNGAYQISYGTSYSVSLGSSVKKGIISANVAYAITKSSSTTVTMSSSDHEKPNKEFEYRVTPLIEVLKVRQKTENTHPGSNSYISRGTTNWRERTLFPKTMSFMTCKKPCKG